MHGLFSLLLASLSFFLAYPFDHVDGGNIFFWNTRLSPNYMTLQPKRLYCLKWMGDRWIIIWKGFGWKQLWPKQLAWRDWGNPCKTLSGYPISKLRFKLGTCWIRSKTFSYCYANLFNSTYTVLGLVVFSLLFKFLK
jgi:hypothetical protein